MIRHLSTGCEEGKAQESHTWWRAESNQLQKQAGILRRIKTVFMQGIYLDITWNKSKNLERKIDNNKLEDDH